MHELSSGFTIRGKYKIAEKRGKGTLGTEIYLGRDLEHDCDVIIRILTQDFIVDEEMSTRFIQGINLTKKLQHQNILKVLDAGREKDFQFVVTNYEKGYFLNEYLEHRGELDEEESTALIKMLAEALAYAWNEQKIIHRNVCPDTILVAKHNVPMLTDFDLAKSLISNNHLTGAGYTIGDPVYMSPEQAKGEEVDFHSDIYCLGLVFYQLLTGAPPFRKNSRMDTLCAQISEKHAPVQTRNRKISSACSSVLDKLLAKDKKDRYQSWKEVVDDLDAVLNRRTPSTMAKTEARPAESNYKMPAVNVPAAGVASVPAAVSKAAANSGSRRYMHAIAAVAVIATIAAILFFTMSNNSNKALKSTQTSSEAKVVTPPAKKPESKPEAKNEVNTSLIKQPDKEEVKKTVKPETDPLPPANSKAETAPKTEPVSNVSDKAKEEKIRQACMSNLKQLSVALHMYANVYEGKFPEPSGSKGLNMLKSGGFLEHPQTYVCPGTGNLPAAFGKPITDDFCDYVYVGGLSVYSDPSTPLLWCKQGNHKDYGNILLINGDVRAVSGSNWLEQTKQKK